MNIFASSTDPKTCAVWLDDVRARQMIRESLQLLSTTINLIEGVDQYPGLYKNFNPNHPCRLWVGSSRQRFVWLMSHVDYLIKLRCPNHVAQKVYSAVVSWFLRYYWKLPDGDLIPFNNSAGNEEKKISYKNMKDTILAYRFYLNARWSTDKRPPTWKTGVKPDWAEC